MRWVRAARVSALVTGLGDAARRGQLLPLGPRAEAWSLAHRLVEDPGPLTRHPPAARRRRIVRAVAAGLVVSAAGHRRRRALRAGGGCSPPAPSLALLGVPLGLGRYAALGHATGPRVVHRPQRLAGPRAGGPAAAGGGGLAGAAVVLPAAAGPGHRHRVRRRRRRRLHGAGHGRRRRRRRSPSPPPSSWAGTFSAVTQPAPGRSPRQRRPGALAGSSPAAAST